MPEDITFARLEPWSVGDWVITPRRFTIFDNAEDHLGIEPSWRNWACSMANKALDRQVHVEHVWPEHDGYPHVPRMIEGTGGLICDCGCGPGHEVIAVSGNVVMIHHQETIA